MEGLVKEVEDAVFDVDYAVESGDALVGGGKLEEFMLLKILCVITVAHMSVGFSLFV